MSEKKPPLRSGHVSIVGRPNVGKSSLINAITGTNRAMVRDMPGTTRDSIDSIMEWNGEKIVLIDTAGRLHTKLNLMEEMKKIKRVMDRSQSPLPKETLMVLDATTGQNAISQARLFNEAVDITGLALTKLDGTAKGGIVVNICHEFNIPIRFIGIGEQMEDLRDFEPNEFVEALFAEGEA